jgi:hypothetical protein
VWSPELSNTNNEISNLNNTADEGSKDGDDNPKKLHKTKKKRSKMDVTKSATKKAPAVKGKRETDESIMQDH